MAATLPCTVVGNQDGRGGMATRSVTVERFKEIERRLRDGRGLREIARALKCSRKTVREVRDGVPLFLLPKGTIGNVEDYRAGSR